MFRDDLEAALQRVAALEQSLAMSEQEQERLRDQRDELLTEVKRLRAEVGRLRYRWREDEAASGGSPVDHAMKSPGDEMVDEVFAAARRKDWDAAFQAIKRLSAIQPHHARLPELLDRLYCTRCKRTPHLPEFTVSPSRYARYWKGRCPRCETALIFRL